MFDPLPTKAEKAERVSRAIAAKARTAERLRVARDAMAGDGMRRMLGGLAPSCVFHMTAKREHAAACLALKEAKALRVTIL